MPGRKGRKLALEMTFNSFTTKCFVGQYDRRDDFVAFNLSGDKRPVVQFLVGEFHSSAVFKCFDPLFVSHFRYLFRRNRGIREYPLFGARNRGSWSKLSSLDQPNHSFQAYALSIEEMTVAAKGALFRSLGKRQWNMILTINNPIRKLRKVPQPPLSRPGATPDSDRAKRPPLSEPSATYQELTPGDRVEGLGNFGKPTGQLGTVERANEDDAVVKWDDDGRMRLHQPSLKKI